MHFGVPPGHSHVTGTRPSSVAPPHSTALSLWQRPRLLSVVSWRLRGVHVTYWVVQRVAPCRATLPSVAWFGGRLDPASQSSVLPPRSRPGPASYPKVSSPAVIAEPPSCTRSLWSPGSPRSRGRRLSDCWRARHPRGVVHAGHLVRWGISRCCLRVAPLPSRQLVFCCCCYALCHMKPHLW